MPRFYFDIREHAGVTRDENGEELLDADAARRRALECSGELLRDYPPDGVGELIKVEVREGDRLIWRVITQALIERLG
jgi:hypothetical protein